MPQKSFLVAGATGDTGRHTAALLLARGHRVRALAHRRDARSEALGARGVEVVVGDLLCFPDVQAALLGMDGAYFVFPVAPGLVQATAFFAEAARGARVGAVVNMSQLPARPGAKSHASLSHWIAERVFDWSGLGVTHLRPTLFAEWLLYVAGGIGPDGVLRLPFEGGKHAPIAAEDQARVIAAILDDPEPHRGKTYPLFGPVELTFPQIAAAMSRTLGRAIRYEPADREAFARTARAGGRDEFLVQHVTEIAQDYRRGIFSGTNDLVERITGRAPITVEDFVARHRAAFGPATSSASSASESL
jgi:uncharacterized protein YbjT (DUF2867 family)